MAAHRCEQALALEPNNPDVQEFLADLQAARGEHDAALAGYRSILQEHPNRASVEAKLAKLVISRPSRAAPPPPPSPAPLSPGPTPPAATGAAPPFNPMPLPQAPYPPPAGWNLPRSGPSPVRAFFSSLVLPGVGQFYNGQYLKGAVILFATVAISVMWGGHMLKSLPEMQMLKSGNPETLPKMPSVGGSAGILVNWMSVVLTLLWVYAVADAVWVAYRKQAASRSPQGW